MGSNLGIYRGWGTPSLAWPENRIQEGWQETSQSRGICSGRTPPSENQGGWRWGSIAVENIKPGNRILAGGRKMWGKKLNGGKQSLLRPDTKSHSCPSHLTQDRRKEVQAVLGCTPAVTWERGRVAFWGG